MSAMFDDLEGKGTSKTHWDKELLNMSESLDIFTETTLW